MEDRDLLISDVDGTLLGDDEALGEFAEWYGSRRERLWLVYNSGRFVNSVLESVASTNLPRPHAIIGGVGTQIRCANLNQPIGDWLDDIEGWHPLRICALLAEYKELELQPAEFLSDYKISYYLADAPAELIDEISQRLADASCRVELVYSSQRDLDVLPQGVHKGSASAYLASYWSFSHDRVIVSGDSGNDLRMFEQGFRGIVVANAHHELRSLATSRVFQSERPFAAGVLDGVTHWLASPNGRLDVEASVGRPMIITTSR